MDDLANDGFADYSAVLHCGVYALVRRVDVVYIGQSKSLSERLIVHIRAKARAKVKRTGFFGSNTIKSGFAFDAIWIRPCMLAELEWLEIEMIRKYQPKYNTNHKTEGYPPELRELIKTISVPPPLNPPVVFRRRA